MVRTIGDPKSTLEKGGCTSERSCPSLTPVVTRVEWTLRTSAQASPRPGPPFSPSHHREPGLAPGSGSSSSVPRYARPGERPLRQKGRGVGSEQEGGGPPEPFETFGTPSGGRDRRGGSQESGPVPVKSFPGVPTRPPESQTPRGPGGRNEDQTTVVVYPPCRSSVSSRRDPVGVLDPKPQPLTTTLREESMPRETRSHRGTHLAAVSARVSKVGSRTVVHYGSHTPHRRRVPRLVRESHLFCG